jgi:hypothetical protein
MAATPQETLQQLKNRPQNKHCADCGDERKIISFLLLKISKLVFNKFGDIHMHQMCWLPS